ADRRFLDLLSPLLVAILVQPLQKLCRRPRNAWVEVAGTLHEHVELETVFQRSVGKLELRFPIAQGKLVVELGSRDPAVEKGAETRFLLRLWHRRQAVVRYGPVSG